MVADALRIVVVCEELEGTDIVAAPEKTAPLKARGKSIRFVRFNVLSEQALTSG